MRTRQKVLLGFAALGAAGALVGGAVAAAAGSTDNPGLARQGAAEGRPAAASQMSGGGSNHAAASHAAPVAGERDYPSAQVRMLPADQSQSTVISRDQAVQLVESKGVRRSAYVGQQPADVRLVRFDSTAMGGVAADGSFSPYFTGDLSWAVTFAGVPVACYGPLGGCAGAAGAVADSVTMVDANSGELLTTFETDHSDLGAY